MPKKASGKKAWGFSDRSGRRYRLRDMRTEWTGVKVGPDEYEEKHPQLNPRSTGGDAEALHDPRPPVEKEDTKLEILGYDTVNLRYREPITARGEVGRLGLGGDVQRAEYVSIALVNNNFMVMEQGSIDTATNTFFPEGLEATMSLGVVSTESVEVNITGVSATGHPANNNLAVAFSVPGQVTVAGFGITASQGTVTITPTTVHAPTGLAATAGQGTITIAAELNISPQITGVQGETSNRSLIPYRDIEDDTDANYLIAGETTGYIHTWTGQTGVLQGNSASGFAVQSFGKGYQNASGVNVNTTGYPSTRLSNGMPEISFRITNNTGLNISLNNNTRCEIEWTLGANQDGDPDAAQHKSSLSWKWPVGINDDYLSASYGLRQKNVVDADSNGGGASGDQFNDGDAGDYTTDVPSGVSVFGQNPVNWEDGKHTYLHLRAGSLSDPSYTSPADSMINLPVTITRMTVMFDDPAANWTATTPASQGFRVDFNTPPNGGVGTATVDIEEPLILTGLEAKATMNDPWNEDDDHGGDGFAEVDGSPSTRWRYTSSPVLRLGWHLDISTPQTWEVSTNGASAYNFYSPASGTTYSNPDLHLHKDNQYIFDMSDSSLQSHPFRLQQTGTSSTGITSTSYNNGSASTYRGTFGATTYSYGQEGNTNNKLYIYPLHADGRPNGVYGDADPSDQTQDRLKSRVGYRTLFYRCEFHAAMRGRFHMAPYCEWPVLGTPDVGTDVPGGDYLQYWTKPSSQKT